MAGSISWPPGAKESNSGVLMRITGDSQALPKSYEAHLQQGNAGDIYGFHGFQSEGGEIQFRTIKILSLD